MSNAMRYITGTIWLSKDIDGKPELMQGICNIFQCKPDDIGYWDRCLYIDAEYDEDKDSAQIMLMFRKLHWLLWTNDNWIDTSGENALDCWSKDGDDTIFLFDECDDEEDTVYGWYECHTINDNMPIRMASDKALRNELKRRHIMRKLTPRKNEEMKRFGTLPTKEEYALLVMAANARRKLYKGEQDENVPKIKGLFPEIYEIGEYQKNAYGPYEIGIDAAPVDCGPFNIFRTEELARECVRRLGAVLADDVDW